MNDEGVKEGEERRREEGEGREEKEEGEGREGKGEGEDRRKPISVSKPHLSICNQEINNDSFPLFHQSARERKKRKRE